VPRQITDGQRAAWAPASRRAASRTFLRVLGRHLDRTRLLAHQMGRRPLYKAKQAVVFLPLLSLFHRHRLAPPLAAAAVEPPPTTQIALSYSPRPHASSGPPKLALFPPKSPHHCFLLQRRRLSITEPPHVANTLHRLPAPPCGFAATAVSSYCSSCLCFRCYHRGSPGCRLPRALCHHGR
jgi:hypothetical protein